MCVRLHPYTRINTTLFRIQIPVTPGSEVFAPSCPHLPHTHTYTQALYRCGMAHMLMQDYVTARELLARAAAMEPTERAIQQAVRECASKQREAESSVHISSVAV